eukprot:m.39392 g.39392  ORF g.39392 m.39392 type:complete len:353 (-) comp10303_c0_seq1:335-1393(-)
MPSNVAVMAATSVPQDIQCEVLERNGVAVVLFGTAHVSERSMRDAERLVNTLRPASVALELCASRQHILHYDLSQAVIRNHPEQSLARAMQAGGGSGMLTHLMEQLYGSLVETLGLEIIPGAEFAAANQAARHVGSLVSLIDRPINTTLKRLWHSLTFMEKIRFVWSLLTDDLSDITPEMIERLKETDVLTGLLEELAGELPNVWRTLVAERDLYLTHQLRLLADATSIRNIGQERGAIPAQLLHQFPMSLQQLIRAPFHQNILECNGQRLVVAIVGLGHVKGIKELWNQELDVNDVIEISHVPPTSALTYVRRAALIAAVPLATWMVYRRVKTGHFPGFSHISMPSLFKLT